MATCFVGYILTRWAIYSCMDQQMYMAIQAKYIIAYKPNVGENLWQSLCFSKTFMHTRQEINYFKAVFTRIYLALCFTKHEGIEIFLK